MYISVPSEQQKLARIVPFRVFGWRFFFFARGIDENVELNGHILSEGILSAMEVEKRGMTLSRLVVEIEANLIVKLPIIDVGGKYVIMNVIEPTRQLPHVHSGAAALEEHFHEVVVIDVLHQQCGS